MTELMWLPRAWPRSGATAGRQFQNSRHIPLSLGTDQHVRVFAERDALGMLFGFEFDLDIVEIGKRELTGPRHALEPTLLPELEQPLLRMRVQDAIALLAAQLDGCVHDLAGDAGVAALVADRQPFELGEIREVTNPHAADRLMSAVANQMGGGEIVAVELLLERAMLLAHVDGAADRDRARHLIHRSHHAHGHRGMLLLLPPGRRHV